MRKFNIIALLLVAIMLLSLFAGCGTQQQGTSDPNTNTVTNTDTKQATTIEEKTENNEPKELVFWHSFTQEDRSAVMAEMAKEFEEKTGVKISVEVYPWAVFHTKWTVGMASQALPDVSSALVDEAMAMATADAVIPMTEVVNELGKDRFIEKPLNLLSKDNEVIALPYYNHARVLFYRKDVLEANGLQPPKTWAELLDQATKVTNAPDIYGMVVPLSKEDYMATSYLYIISESMGSHLFTEEEKVNLTDPNMIKAINFLVELFKKASPPGTINYGDVDRNDIFYKGKAVFDINTGFAINGIYKNNPEMLDKIGCVNTPVWNEGDELNSSFADYISLVMWKKTTSPTYAKDFVKSMYEKDSYIKFLHLVPGGMLPILKDIADSPEFLDHPIIKQFENDIEHIKKGIEVGYPVGGEMAGSPYMNIVKNQGIIEEMFHNIIINNVSTEQAAKETEDRINKAIEEAKLME